MSAEDPRADVLARNVERLVRHAYVPVLPRPEFRAELGSAWKRELRRRHGGALAEPTPAERTAPAPAVHSPPPPHERVPRWAASLAAVLLLTLGSLSIWWFAARPTTPTTDAGRTAETRAGPTEPVDAPLGSRSPGVEPGATIADPEPRPEPELVAASTTDARTALASPDRGGEGGVEGPASPESPAPVDARTGGVEGRFLDAAGAPLTEFRVGLRVVGDPTEFQPTRTRDVASGDGRFRWDDVPEGRYEVFVGAEGHALASLGRHELGGHRANPWLEHRLESGGSLRGHVIDGETGIGIPNALVVTERDTPQPVLPMDLASVVGTSDPAILLDVFWLPAATFTRADGSFELEHLSTGTHTIRATSPGYAPAWSGAVEVASEGATETDLLLELGPGGVLEGRVEHEDGTPWSGAPVIATLMGVVGRPQNNYGMARTDVDGRYRIEDLPSEPMLAILPHPDPLATSQGSRGPRVKPVQILSHATARVDFLPTSHGIGLRGQLVDADGEPVKYRNLALFDASRGPERMGINDFLATSTDARGGFLFEGLETGPHALFLVEDMGRWIRWLGMLEVERGPEDGAPPRRVVLGAGSVRAIVIDGRNGQPVPGVELRLERAEAAGDRWYAGSGTSGEDGSCRFEPLPHGRYRVLAHAPRPGARGEPPLAFALGETVELHAGQPSAELTLVLPAGAPLTLLLEDDQGRPVEEASLTFHPESGPRSGVQGTSSSPTAAEALRFISSAFGSGGRHDLVVPPGSYRLEAHTASGHAAPVPFEAHRGDGFILRAVIHEDAERSDAPPFDPTSNPRR